MYRENAHINTKCHKVAEETTRFESTLITRNIRLFGKRTSIRLEPAMWDAFEDIAQREQCDDNDLCSLIFMLKKRGTSMTAAIRVFIMLYYRTASTLDGHKRAGHGDFEGMLRRANIAPQDFERLKKLEQRVKISNIAQVLQQDSAASETRIH